MKKIQIVFILLAFMIAACGGKKEVPPSEMIAGTSSKIWKAKKEYDSSGDKVKMSDSEANETMRFYANGDFSIQAADEMANGTWSYDEASKTLKLAFEGENYSENFSVAKMESDEISLVAGDGSKLILTSR